MANRMGRGFVFTDTDGRKFKVWMRGWYQDKITGAKKLKAFKQKAADEQRAKGRESYAKAIESQTIMRWTRDSGILVRSERIR